MAFVHLHLHTIYSFLDGLVKPAELAKKLTKLGMNAVAITDHGNMHGVVDFYTTMIGKDEKGNFNKIENAVIKPIIGMEAYISANDRREKVAKDAFHLLLLAENEKGYKNLCYMASTAFVDGFYYKPRIDRALIKDHAEGIIATSACLGGEIPQAIAKGRYDDAKRIALEYIELFGKNNFFIELQVNGMKEQEEANPLLIKLARELGVGLVATNDVHYLSPEHAEAQDILFCINEKKKVTDTDRMHHETAAFYLKSEEEMRELFSVYGEAGTEAIENTVKIAERCSVQLDLGHNYLPIFDTGDKSPAQFLRDMAEQGLEERFLELGTPEDKKQAYRDRLEYELGVIIRMDFPGYFLIVSDFIRWAKNHGIPVGPGRGSGAGSLVAYCTRITDLDPLRYELLFERFLNPERISMPDFDVDFCQDNRERVIEYVESKYGFENVAQIATFGQLKAKSAIRDVARALD
ncbi:DNA polymerase III subunit alpha, partial [bacterium]|nr:DNA polymerase III subunit alpha [bacterium]